MKKETSKTENETGKLEVPRTLEEALARGYAYVGGCDEMEANITGFRATGGIGGIGEVEITLPLHYAPETYSSDGSHPTLYVSATAVLKFGPPIEG